MSKFRRQFDNSYKGHKGFVTTQPSLTVPDMNLTIKELLHNHSRGISSDIHNYEPQYFEDEVPQILDLTDLQENREKLIQQQKQIDDEIRLQKASQELTDKHTITPPPSTPKTGNIPVPETKSETQKTVP